MAGSTPWQPQPLVVVRQGFPVPEPSGEPPVITLQPLSDVVDWGTQVTLVAGASGDPAPSVVWQSLSGSVWSNIGGATNTAYVFTATSYSSYRAVFTNEYGEAITNAASITVLD